MANWLSRSSGRALQLMQRGRPDPLTSVVLTVPVFLVYHLGVLLIDTRNGVDLVSELTLQLLEHSVLGYVGVTLALAFGLVLVMFLMRKRGRLRPTDPALVLAESLVWAAVMLVTVGAATQQVTSALEVSAMALSTAITALGPIDKLVMAAGAGLHEEIVFRAGLLHGGALLLTRFTALSRARALAFTLVLSSLLFAVVHHLGPLGDPLAFAPFVFRTFAGVFLSAIYLVRGFAIVVYTHTLYDLLVFFVL